MLYLDCSISKCNAEALKPVENALFWGEVSEIQSVAKGDHCVLQSQRWQKSFQITSLNIQSQESKSVRAGEKQSLLKSWGLQTGEMDLFNKVHTFSALLFFCT